VDSGATTSGFNFDDNTPDTLIGPYKLIRQIGEGGMGVVYHAQQTQPIRRDVALKVIKPGMDTKQVIARFETERQALAVMDHPNIAHVFEAGTTAQGRPYFVMELVDGVPITQYCDSKRLTVRERIELFIPVCGAIQHAHQKGIIHRDIKPSNILITEHEGKSVPKVIDFGLAKALGHQLSDASMMTNVGMVVGTPDYMSPEQAELTRQDVDTRADVYSLGAVLYELLTGTPPLNRESLENAPYIDVLKTIREQEPPTPSTRLRHSTTSVKVASQRNTDPALLPKLLNGELDWITMKALEKDRTRRYETVNALARDIERYLEGEPVEAAPPSATYRLSKFVRKHRVWLATATAFATLLIAAVVVSSWMAVRASRAELEARAVNDFLQKDVLSQATAFKQGGADTKPDPDLKVRVALDRAAAGIEGKFAAQPLVEASIRHTIGEAYVELGLYAEAQRQLEKALELQVAASGEKQRASVVDMNDLAEVYLSEGRYSDAEALLTKALPIGRGLLGEKDPDVLTSMHDLGGAYFRQGKVAQSEALTLTALDMRRRVLGEENPDTLRTASNLTVIYTREGKYAQAENLVTKAVELQRKVSGEAHPYTLRITENLADLYRLEGKYTQAEPLYIRVVALSRDVLGPEHAETLSRMSGLAELYADEERYPEAGDLLSTVVNAQRRVLSAEHPDTLYSLSLLAKAFLAEQKYVDAEAALREALNGYEKTRPMAWQRFKIESMLGESLAGEKKYTEAERLLLSGYNGLLEKPASIPVAYKSTLPEAGDRMVKLYQDWGKPDKAAEWKQKLQSVERDRKQN
jgi:non-specific serine/threonine protein kinase/serine/threonine-protein kinase